MANYEPELGQAVFGQPYKQYECPEWLIAYLDYIEKELDRVYWNINQNSIESPFRNTGGKFKNGVMETGREFVLTGNGLKEDKSNGL